MNQYFIGVWNLANCVTYLGIGAAVIGIFYAENPRIAMLMLLIAGICDLFDGRVARMFPRTEVEKRFGIQLDSFADTVSFVILPAVFLLAQSHTFYSALIAIAYVFAGVTRLCWFDITTDGATKYFQGMPVTFIALLLPLLYAVAALAKAGDVTWIAAAVMIAMAVLFVANIPVKKPGAKGAVVLLVIAIAICAVLLAA